MPTKYIRMGVSPRIIPKSYGKSINNSKSILREMIYEKISEHDTSKVIVDFDLKSCYTSIRLFPSRHSACETTGLWEYIREEFERNNVLNHYNKSAVKICVYSSFLEEIKRCLKE
jgi:hypothetical protein